MVPTEIVYFALNRWDSLLQREQHLITRLSGTYRVLFIDPPLSFMTILSGKIRGRPWTFKSHLLRESDHLTLYTPPAFPPFSHYSKPVHTVHTRILISQVKHLLKKFSIGNYILGIGSPFLGNIIKKFDPRLSYYDCSDDYLASPALLGKKTMLKILEEDLVKSVDLVFCSGRRLQEDKSLQNKNCFLVPNGVDLSTFLESSSIPCIPPDMEKIKKPIMGYLGLIDDRLDFDILLELAGLKKEWSFVFIGPWGTKRPSSSLTSFPNIHVLGEKNFKELPRYLRLFDVCLIPFKVNTFTERIYPTKLHQYLAAGKPVISSHLPDLESFTPWVEFYSDVKEMEVKIERFLQEDSEEKVLERRKIASRNTWDQRVETMIQIVNQMLQKQGEGS